MLIPTVVCILTELPNDGAEVGLPPAHKCVSELLLNLASCCIFDMQSFFTTLFGKTVL